MVFGGVTIRFPACTNRRGTLHLDGIFRREIDRRTAETCLMVAAPPAAFLRLRSRLLAVPAHPIQPQVRPINLRRRCQSRWSVPPVCTSRKPEWLQPPKTMV